MYFLYLQKIGNLYGHGLQMRVVGDTGFVNLIPNYQRVLFLGYQQLLNMDNCTNLNHIQV
ncbi:hypothetical protein D3C87_1221900 [compost metagenome]